MEEVSRVSNLCLFVCSQSQASGVVNSSVTVCDSNAAVHSSFSASIRLVDETVCLQT